MNNDRVIRAFISVAALASVTTTLAIYGHHVLTLIGLVGLIMVCLSAVEGK